VSCVPSVLSLIILFAVAPLYAVKYPPTITLPSACTANEVTELLNQFQILKLVSLVPSELSLIILFAVAPLYAVKYPPTITLPSACTANEPTPSLNQSQILKLVSLVPSVLSLMILFAVASLYAIKSPPTITLPSACTANEVTAPSNQSIALLKSKS
jgi:allophanate hydrolase subunit 1